MSQPTTIPADNSTSPDPAFVAAPSTEEVTLHAQLAASWRDSLRALADQAGGPEQFELVLSRFLGRALPPCSSHTLYILAGAALCPAPCRLRIVDEVSGETGTSYAAADGGTVFIARALLEEAPTLRHFFAKAATQHLDEWLGGTCDRNSWDRVRRNQVTSYASA